MYSYVLAPQDLSPGDTIQSGPGSAIKPGNTLPLKDIPVGMPINSIELQPLKGGQLCRAAGCMATIVNKQQEHAIVRLPSGKGVKVFCTAKSCGYVVCRCIVNKQQEHALVIGCHQVGWGGLGVSGYEETTKLILYPCPLRLLSSCLQGRHRLAGPATHTAQQFLSIVGCCANVLLITLRRASESGPESSSCGCMCVFCL